MANCHIAVLNVHSMLDGKFGERSVQHKSSMQSLILLGKISWGTWHKSFRYSQKRKCVKSKKAAQLYFIVVYVYINTVLNVTFLECLTRSYKKARHVSSSVIGFLKASTLNSPSCQINRISIVRLVSSLSARQHREATSKNLSTLEQSLAVRLIAPVFDFGL